MEQAIVIDQNRALASLELNLLPGRSLIDDRSERERLSFLAEFASLINYYDEHNTIKGNWTPFLLKDPVFLVATISGIRFDKWNALYVNSCLKIEKEAPLTLESRDLGASFNELFDQFMKVFSCIERWTFYMQKMDDAYDLKKYVLHKVESIFSRYFWALRSFKESLFLSGMISRITPVHYLQPGTYNDKLWMQNKDKNPYWQVLGLKSPITDNTATDFFHALRSTGDELFVFFHTAIQHAAPEYEKLRSAQSKYPDTTLLRAFIDLLKIQQEQLNGLSAKHLEFYYHDILKQSKLFAIPDHVILCAETAKKDAAFHLPAGTLFDAGMDKQKNPVYFESREEVTLNPAAITTAYTLSCLPDDPAFPVFSSLYFQAIENPGTVEKMEDGTIRQWETFGGATPPPESEISLGIAFASPLLLLREGQRSITLTFTFESEIEAGLLTGASYYLSTAAAWLQVVPSQPVGAFVETQAVVQIDLDPSQPAIEKFLADPDGLNSLWPMLKIEFSSFTDMAAPPVITGLLIKVNAGGVKNLQLYNDNGLLTTKTPFQLFGPIPLKNSSFIIGSNEIFSKPFDTLSLSLDWDSLAMIRDFSLYYVQYNAYLNPVIIVEPGPVIPPLMEEKPSFFKRVKDRLKRLFTRKSKLAAPAPASATSDPAPAPDPVYLPGPFNNFCFTVGFQLLTDSTWEDFGMVKTVTDPPDSFTPYQVDSTCLLPQQPVDQAHLLFSTDSTCLLTNYSTFGYTSPTPEEADPYIQQVPLAFTDTSTSGFMKMALSAPDYGFGSELYPNLVSAIALQNAALLIGIDENNTTPDFLPPAVMPYVPKLVSISADYSAEKQYDLTATQGDYPLQCFFYSPFENYLIYDNTPAAPVQTSSAGLTITGMRSESSGIPLFPQLNYKGVLFLEIENLVAADSLNIFFELSRKYGTSSGSRTIDYNYLSATGWKKLKVLADDTNNFTCSGVVKVNVPVDMATDSLVFPGKKFWISIGVTEDPGNFAETVYLKTNGFDVYRSGISFLAVTEKPFIPAGTIVQTKSPVPEIATILQPFASEGGRAAETERTMNQRVSNRMKTKDRAVTSEDYFRLIREWFDDIYYSKVIYDPVKRITGVYVVKAYDRATDPSAFLPLVSECKEGKIQSFLKERASAFANISVSNFKLEYVRVKATLTLSAGYEKDGVRQDVIDSINIYLSPWITSAQQQVAIDQGLSDAELGAFIKTIAGVASVESVSFMTCVMYALEEKFVTPVSQEGCVIKPLSPAALFVPYTAHDIQFPSKK